MDQISEAWRKDRILKVWLTSVLFQISVGTICSSNHLQGKEWDFGGSVSRFAIDKLGGHIRVLLSKSYGEGWFFAISSFLEHKRVGNSFKLLCFPGT